MQHSPPGADLPKAFLFALPIGLMLASLSDYDKRIGWPGDNVILAKLLRKERLWIGPARHWIDQKSIRFRWRLLGKICTPDGSENSRRYECRKSWGCDHDWLSALVLFIYECETCLDKASERQILALRWFWRYVVTDIYLLRVEPKLLLHFGFPSHYK